MNETVVVQEREITNKEIGLIQKLIAANPSWNRTRLSKELCVLWNWRAANGQIKDMACRTFLWKLEKRGYLSPYPLPKNPGGRLSAGESCPMLPMYKEGDSPHLFPSFRH